MEALRDDFRTASKLADLLGVDRSQITRWLRGAGIDLLNAEKIDLLELVWAIVSVWGLLQLARGRTPTAAH